MNRSTVNWTVQKLYSQVQTGKATSENEIQRGVVWGISQKSLFIHSLILNYPIPTLYAEKIGRNQFSIIDGKQRTTTICDFIDGKFALKDIPIIVDDEDMETDLNGMRYADLPEDFKNALDGYSLTITLLENAEREEIEDIFYRLNNGTPLRANDKSFAKAKSKAAIQQLANHRIFYETMTSNARAKLTQRTIVVQSLIMLSDDEHCLDAKAIGPYMRDQEISDADVERLSAIYDKFLELRDELTEESKDNHFVVKKMLSRGNIPTLSPFIESHGDDEKILPFLKYFFSGNKGNCINDEYTLASRQGSGHTKNVEIRERVLNDEWNKF